VLAYHQLESLQGQYIPHLLAFGTINQGRDAFVALTDAGTSMQDLVLQCDALLEDHALTQQVGGHGVSSISCCGHEWRSWAN
jgi:hypothetical protein